MRATTRGPVTGTRTRRARRPIGAVVAFTVLTACGACSSVFPEYGSGDAELAATLRTYVVEFLKRNPTTNTYLGGAGLDPALAAVDGTLRDYSAQALREEDAWLVATKARIEAVNARALRASPVVDRAVALAQIEFQLHQHQVRQYQQRALDTYVTEPFRAIDWQLQGLTDLGEGGFGTPDEWALVLARVRAVPAFLDRAEAQIAAGVTAGRTPDRRMLERDGLDATSATATFFADTLPAIARTRLRGTDALRRAADLTQASRDAAAAYRAFRAFIAATFFDDADARVVKPAFAGDRYALGEAEYDWALAHNFKITSSASALFEQSSAPVDATRREMVALARTIIGAPPSAAGVSDEVVVRRVFDQLSNDYPKSDAEMVQWYRDAAARLVEYARQTQMFDVPATYALDVIPTPAPLEASIDGAAYYPAPPFRNTGVGRFYVSPTHEDVAALKTNNRAAIADLAAHEGFPGHDWYYKVLTDARAAVSPVRWLTPGAVEDSSSMWQDSMSAEGWGLYAEALMAEPRAGSPQGFYRPEERLYQLQGQLYRDLRVRIDTGLHTGRLTYDAAVTLFSEVVDFLPGSCANAGALADSKRASCQAAERAIFRYSKWPTQAITYRLGKDAIYALREAAQKRLAERYSATEFHLTFIRQGTIPPGYFGTHLLDELAQGGPFR